MGKKKRQGYGRRAGESYYLYFLEKDQPSSLSKKNLHFFFQERELGHLGGSVVGHLHLAQVMIPGSWDQVLHPAPCMEPVSPSAYVSAPLSVCLS